MKFERHGMLAAMLTIALAACGGADTEPAEMMDDPDIAPAGEAMGLPAGYALRLDRAGGNAADYRAMAMPGGLHIQTGPAGVMYDEASSTIASGNYSVSASFTEIGAPPNHREAFGIFIGGRDLQGPDVAYTYFLVRADGQYLIKRRMGEETMNVGDGWVPSPAVNSASGTGDVLNTLEVRVEGEQVHFTINGTRVTTVPASAVDPYGVAGVRVNHNLNVMVSDWMVSRS